MVVVPAGLGGRGGAGLGGRGGTGLGRRRGPTRRRRLTAGQHRTELEAGRAADDRLGLLAVAHPRELHHDGAALAGDVGLGDTQAVDALADDVLGLLDRFLGGELAVHLLGLEDDGEAALQVEAEGRRRVAGHGSDHRDHRQADHQDSSDVSRLVGSLIVLPRRVDRHRPSLGSSTSIRAVTRPGHVVVRFVPRVDRRDRRPGPAVRTRPGATSTSTVSSATETSVAVDAARR